jgi:hypothetical protein
MVMLTDYILSAASFFFAVRLWRGGFRPWALAFAFTAIGSLAGGTYHGIGPLLDPRVDAALWKLTVYAIGLASFFLLTGGAVAATAGKTRRALVVIAVLKFVAYATWMIGHDDFVYVIVDYGLSLVIIAALYTIAWRRSAASPAVLSSIALAVIAAAVQQSRVSLHPNFDHNVLYHVIQLASLWMLYRGGMLLAPSRVGRE